MKLVTTTVGRRGPEGEEHNGERLGAAEQALTEAIKLGADVLVLPGGFFTAQTAQTRNSIAASLINIARPQNIAVVFGVDQSVKNLSADFRPEIRKGTLPFYVYVWSPTNEGPPYPWNQRSTNSDNQWDASEARCRAVRLLRVKDEILGVLICGEIFNQRIREALANNRPRPKVVIDVAHVGSRFRVFQGMKKLAELGLASLCSVHVQREYATKHCWVPPGRNISIRIPDSHVYGPPRIELKLWQF